MGNYTKKEKNFWGVEKEVHYENNVRVGETRFRETILGGKVQEHFDNSGKKTGETRRESWFFSDRAVHYDDKGNKVGYTKDDKTFLGDKVQRHYDSRGNLVGKSNYNKDFFGFNKKCHTGIYFKGGKSGSENQNIEGNGECFDRSVGSYGTYHLSLSQIINLFWFALLGLSALLIVEYYLVNAFPGWVPINSAEKITAPERLTVRLTDQYGLPITTIKDDDEVMWGYLPSLYLLDSAGDKVPGRFCPEKGCVYGPQNENGGVWVFEKDIPYGNYQVIFTGGECCGSSGGISRERTAFKKEINISGDREKSFKLVAETKDVKISLDFNAVLVNQFGTPLGLGAFSCYLKDKSGNIVSNINPLGGNTCYDESLRGRSKPLSSGSYILFIERSGYLPFEKNIIIPDISALSDNEARGKVPRFQDDIVLIKKK